MPKVQNYKAQLSQAPASLGFRMPAEWERHEATWIAWPHHRNDWPGKFQPIPWVYSEIVKHLTRGEKVCILVESRQHQIRVRNKLIRTGVNLDKVEFFCYPTNRNWVRDYGPCFIKQEGVRPEVAIAGFRFNGWARYPNHEKDARIASRIAKKLRLKSFKVTWQGRPVVLEGGGIDVNGQGTLMTTEECFLDSSIQVRNPGLSREDYEKIFADYLGIQKTIWLGKGIAGDDTHGHVDDLCRFVNAQTVVLSQEENPEDINYKPLQENRERLQSMTLENGTKIETVFLPMPSPVYFEGIRLPASYANFYVSNAVVLVPTFNDPKDRLALGILSELFPDREVIGIHAVDLVWGLGTLHCLTHEQPAVDG